MILLMLFLVQFLRINLMTIVIYICIIQLIIIIIHSQLISFTIIKFYCYIHRQIASFLNSIIIIRLRRSSGCKSHNYTHVLQLCKAIVRNISYRKDCTEVILCNTNFLQTNDLIYRLYHHWKICNCCSVIKSIIATKPQIVLSHNYSSPG